MSLSNTAVPKYYGEFRDAVLRGEIPVCREIEMQMNLIDQLIEDPNMYYDDEAVEGWIRFCENELTLTDGSDVHLLDSFKLWGEDALSWYYFVERSVYRPGKNGEPGKYVRSIVKRRLRSKQYLIVARGAAKSLYETFMQAYSLTCDPMSTYQITVAPTMKQAEEVMSPLRTAITRAKGPYFTFLTSGSNHNTTGSRANRQKLYSAKDCIKNDLTNSYIEIRPMTIDKLQGMRCKVATVDEWLSGEIREDPIGAIEQGCSKIDDYLIFAVSSEGTIRNGVGDSIKMELYKILKGEYVDPHTSVWIYRLDDISEVNDPEMWVKAQPNLGKTVSYEAYQRDVARAEANPAARNDILAKRFGIPMEGYTYYFTYEQTLPHRYREYWGMQCAMGADFSRGDDFCAFTFMFPLSTRWDSKHLSAPREFGIKTRCYISSRTLEKLPGATREKYEEFMREGTLHVMEGSVLDMQEIYQDIDAFIEDCRYDVRAFGYDPYNAKPFVERWCQENSEYGVEMVVQGRRTETVPLGELHDMAEDRLLLFDEAMMQYCMGNCIVLQDINGQRMLTKNHYDEKIDSVAAMLDAWVAYKVWYEQFD